MATLTAWRFDDPGKAEEAMETLQQLHKEASIQVIDAAWVSWPEEKKKPRTHQLHHLAAAGSLGGGFWGFLFGLIFLVPLLGLAIGAAAGALAGSLADVGISDDFVNECRAKVTPGTSALFALTDNADEERVQEAFAGFHPQLISSNLSHEQEDKLREAFTD